MRAFLRAFWSWGEGLEVGYQGLDGRDGTSIWLGRGRRVSLFDESEQSLAQKVNNRVLGRGRMVSLFDEAI